jgi:phospholipase C
MVTVDCRTALDHVVVVMFENRSFDNLLGRLYQPGSVRHRPRVLEVGLGFEEVGVAASVDLDP